MERVMRNDVTQVLGMFIFANIFSYSNVEAFFKLLVLIATFIAIAFKIYESRTFKSLVKFTKIKLRRSR